MPNAITAAIWGMQPVRNNMTQQAYARFNNISGQLAAKDTNEYVDITCRRRPRGQAPKN